jgi:cation:H+ antiporter
VPVALDPSLWSLPWAITAFLVAAVVIAFAGTFLAGLADRLADLTGMGEAVTGALLLGAGTSLPGILTSTVAAGSGYPQLAVSNAVGGLAAQTVFLVVADLFHRKANLEHAAASVPNILNGTLLIALLGLILTAAALPSFTVWAVHPVSPLLFAAYWFGLRLSRHAHEKPAWTPEQTPETEEDDGGDAEKHEGHTVRGTALKFVGLLAIIFVAGWVVARSGQTLASSTGMNESFVGAGLTAVATSLPELVTSIAAVRRGALTLAVGNIIGGNAFDTLFCGAADVAYRDGSIYHAVAGGLGRPEQLLIAVTVLMTAVLVAGMVRRQKQGPGGIGFESVLILLLYAGTLAAVGFAF